MDKKCPMEYKGIADRHRDAGVLEEHSETIEDDPGAVLRYVRLQPRCCEALGRRTANTRVIGAGISDRHRQESSCSAIGVAPT